jgi:hypothetical protein
MSTNPFVASLALRMLYVPSWVKNYGLAVLDVELTPLLVASLASSAFYCLAFCYIGSTIDTLADAAAGNASGNGKIIESIITVFSLLLTLGVLVSIGLMVKKYVAREEEIQREESPALIMGVQDEKEEETILAGESPLPEKRRTRSANRNRVHPLDEPSEPEAKPKRKL